jgi:hypothetical protein
MSRRRFTPHYNVATLHEITVGDKRFSAIMSTNPAKPYQVATYDRAGFVDPRSLAWFANPASAIAEVDRRANAEIADVAKEIDDGWSYTG